MLNSDIKNEWYANKEEVRGVVEGSHGKCGWQINYEELSKITNNHPEFMVKVKEFADKELKWAHNAKVYRWFSGSLDTTKNDEYISIVFDMTDTYIKIISCCIEDHERYPYVFENSFNKSYVWLMGTML